jgi:hypothetical protein
VVVVAEIGDIAVVSVAVVEQVLETGHIVIVAAAGESVQLESNPWSLVVVEWDRSPCIPSVLLGPMLEPVAAETELEQACSSTAVVLAATGLRQVKSSYFPS